MVTRFEHIKKKKRIHMILKGNMCQKRHRMENYYRSIKF